MGILVSIICTAYNHQKYIKNALDGFLMQNTDFSFEVLVHDDASSDNTPDIIREYESKYPHIIRAIYQKENKYSKGVNIWHDILFPMAKGKYIAICEGDDYWIDAYKLQKQVGFLESKQTYSMTCSNAIILNGTNELDWTRYNIDSDITPEEMILGGGGYVMTASLVFRKSLLDQFPSCAKECYVGDYPLQIFAAINGKVRWFVEKQVVYRYQTESSWTESYLSSSIYKKMDGWNTEINMLRGLDAYNGYIYTNAYNEYEAHFIFIRLISNKGFIKLIKLNFINSYNKLSIRKKLVVLIYQYHCDIILKFMRKIKDIL